MLKHRVIPSLLLHNDGLVKTIKFKDPKYVGDPINAIKIFNEKEVDELMLLDITASKKKRSPNYKLIEQIAGECFMPLTYGGGIKSEKEASQIFSLGVEKICLQTAVLDNLPFITSLAERFGSQSITVSIDLKKNWLGKTYLHHASTGKLLKEDSWLENLKKMVHAGAGEVLLNSVDKDGTMSGPALDLIQQASDAIDVPLVAVGGISNLEDIKAAVDAGASAVAAGSFFVFQGPHRAVLITYPKYHELEKLFRKT